MTLAFSDFVLIFLAFVLAGLADKLIAWACYRATGKCIVCIRRRAQREFERELEEGDRG